MKPIIGCPKCGAEFEIEEPFSSEAVVSPLNVDEYEQELTNILLDMEEAIFLINNKKPYRAGAILEHSKNAIRRFMAKKSADIVLTRS